MQKTLLAILVITLVTFPLVAEINQMRIVGQAEKTADIVPARYQTVNRERAACIIFTTDLDVDIDFRPRVELVALVEPGPGEYLVYVAPNERVIMVHALGFEPLQVVLRDFGISVLRSGDVYRFRLTGDRMERRDDRDLFTVEFNIQPEDVFISHNNNAPVPVRGSRGQFRLAAGNHRFRFSKQGYADKNIELSVTENSSQSVALERGTTETQLELQGFVVIESEPSGADLYLNEQRVGVTPYQGQLIAGNYNYRLSLPLYNSQTGSFSLSQAETVNLPKINLVPRFGTLAISSNPAGADVLINNSNRGQTPIERLRLDSGEYSLEIRQSLYHTHTEDFELKDGENKNLNIRLKPAFGELVIDSSPEQGAKVFIDDREVGVTPHRNQRQPSGRYVVRLEKDLYSPVTRQIEVHDEQTTRENISMSPNFGTITVISDGAEIFLDDRSVGRERYQGRLPQGRYSFTAKKDRHIDAQENVFIQVGENREIKLEPRPRQGAVSVVTQPFEARGANITINNERRTETTPAVIPLLMGNYDITVNHRDFLDQTRQVSIREGQTINLEFTMQTYRGSMQAKRNFWRTNKWISLAGTVIALGGAVYFDFEGQSHSDDFHSADNPAAEMSAFNSAESSFDNRDLCYYVSIGPAIYTVYSWIRQASYNRKIK